MSWPSVGNIIGNVNFIFAGDASKLRTEYANLVSAVAEMNEFFGQVVMMLHKRKAIDATELSGLINHYTKLAYPNLIAVVAKAKINHNPLTPEEADLLQVYIDRANARLPFADSEINDYYQLVEKAKEEETEEFNPWPLVALGGFLLGLWLGSRHENQE